MVFAVVPAIWIFLIDKGVLPPVKNSGIDDKQLLAVYIETETIPIMSVKDGVKLCRETNRSCLIDEKSEETFSELTEDGLPDCLKEPVNEYFTAAFRAERVFRDALLSLFETAVSRIGPNELDAIKDLDDLSAYYQWNLLVSYLVEGFVGEKLTNIARGIIAKIVWVDGPRSFQSNLAAAIQQCSLSEFVQRRGS